MLGATSAAAATCSTVVASYPAVEEQAYGLALDRGLGPGLLALAQPGYRPALRQLTHAADSVPSGAACRIGAARLRGRKSRASTRAERGQASADREQQVEAVHERRARRVREGRRSRTLRDGEPAEDALACRARRVRGQAGQVEPCAVAGAEHGPEDRRPERAADHAHGLVDRRSDAAGVLRQRAERRVGRGGHREAEADAADGAPQPGRPVPVARARRRAGEHPGGEHREPQARRDVRAGDGREPVGDHAPRPASRRSAAAAVRRCPWRRRAGPPGSTAGRRTGRRTSRSSPRC